MPAALRLTLLVIAVAALADVGVRAASTAARDGAARAVAAAPIAVALAVGQSLALGLVGLGTNAVALGSATALTWLGSRRLLPDPQLTLFAEVRERGRSLSRRAAVVVGSLAGAVAAAAVWFLLHPYVGFDGLLHHLAEVNQWVHDGRPGSLQEYIPTFPVESYPLVHELALSWLVGISRTFVPVTLWMLAMLVLLGSSVWLACRSLDVSRRLAALAVVAVVALPPVLAQLHTPKNDLPALAWLACAGALCAAASRHPGLLAPALVAAGLSAGTKTTTVPLALLVVAVAAWEHRRSLRRLGGPLLLAGLAAAVVGTTWYVRNLLAHGSPFWPLVATPWGDPVPGVFGAVDETFLDDPVRTLRGQFAAHVEVLAGGLVLLVGGSFGWLLSRRRQVAGASVATAVAFVLWANAPATGVANVALAGSAILSTARYLLPAVVAGAVALVLAGRQRTVGGRVAIGLLAVAGTANLARAVLGPPDIAIPLPLVPLRAMGAGAVVGALGGLVLRQGGPRVSGVMSHVPHARPALALGCALLVGALLAPLASGYMRRQAETFPLRAGGLVDWLVDQPTFEDGDAPVAMTNYLHATLAGDSLAHPVELIPAGEPCRDLERRAERGWVVLTLTTVLPGVDRPDAPLSRGCFAGAQPSYVDTQFVVFGNGLDPPPRRSRS